MPCEAPVTTATLCSALMIPTSQSKTPPLACLDNEARLRRSAGSKRIVVASLQHRVQLSPPDAHITAVEDRQRERILQQASERSFVIIAFDADDAHEIGNDAHRGLGAKDLRLDCEFLGRWRLGVERVTGAPTQVTRCFDRGFCIGQSVSDRLVLDDGVNAATLLGAGKMKRKIERRAHQRDAENTDECRGACERRRRQCEACALLSEQIMARRCDILQTELRNEMRSMTDRVNRTFEYKALHRSFHRNDGDRR